MVVPLPHTATVRVLLPRVGAPARRAASASALARRGSEPGRRSRPERGRDRGGLGGPHGRRRRVELPEPLLDGAGGGVARALVLGAGRRLPRPGRAGGAGQRAAGPAGAIEPLGPLARALVDAQRLNGAVRVVTTAAMRPPRCCSPPRRCWPPVPRPGRSCSSARSRRRCTCSARAGAAGGSAGTGAAALALVAPALRAVGQPEVADDAVDGGSARRARSAGRRPGRPIRRMVRATGSVAERGRRCAAGGRAVSRPVAELVELVPPRRPGSVGDRYDAGHPRASGLRPRGGRRPRVGRVRSGGPRRPRGPGLLPVWPEAWWGRPAEAHGVRTRTGWCRSACAGTGHAPRCSGRSSRGRGSTPTGPVLAPRAWTRPGAAGLERRGPAAGDGSRPPGARGPCCGAVEAPAAPARRRTRRITPGPRRRRRGSVLPLSRPSPVPGAACAGSLTFALRRAQPTRTGSASSPRSVKLGR